MRKSIIPFALCLLLYACTKPGSNSVSSNALVEESTLKPFQKMMFLISVKANDSSYLVTDKIDSLEVYLNTDFWAKTNTEGIDTTEYNKYTSGNTFLSSQKVSYLSFSSRNNVQLSQGTAGQFAEYLNGNFDVQPGEYACYIRSFQVKYNDGTRKKFFPNHYQVFDIKAGETNAYVGEIELKIY